MSIRGREDVLKRRVAREISLPQEPVEGDEEDCVIFESPGTLAHVREILLWQYGCNNSGWPCKARLGITPPGWSELACRDYGLARRGNKSGHFCGRQTRIDAVSYSSSSKPYEYERQILFITLSGMR